MPPAHVLAWLDQAVKPYAQPIPTTLAVTSSLDTYSSIKIKTDQFTFDDGRTLLLLCLHGTLPITYAKAKYNVPLSIWFPIEYPSLPPIVYVVPTSSMLVRKGRGVDLDGRVNEDEWDYLNGWKRKPEAHSILPLLQSLVDAFSIYPPVYAKPTELPATSGSRPNDIQPQSQYLHSSASTSGPHPTASLSPSTRITPGQGDGRLSISPPPPPPLPPAAFPPGPPLPPVPSITSQPSPGSPSRSFFPGAPGEIPYANSPQLQQKSSPFHSHPQPHPQSYSYNQQQQHHHHPSPGPNTDTNTHPSSSPNSHYRSAPSAQQSFSSRQPQSSHQAYRQHQHLEPHSVAYIQNRPYSHSPSSSFSDPRTSVQPPSRANTAPGSSQAHNPSPGLESASLNTASSSIPQLQAQPQPLPKHQSQPAPPKVPIPDLLGTLDDPLPASQTPTNQYTGHSAPPPPPPNPEILHLQTHLQSSLTSTLDATLSALDTQQTHLQTINDDLRAAKPAIEDEMARLKAVRDVCATVGGRMRTLVAQGEDRVKWVAGREGSVDEVICGVDLVGNQLIDLVAEDAAISDTIYQLNRALTAERIDLERFLKTVRILAREQFMKRALIEKILKG